MERPYQVKPLFISSFPKDFNSATAFPVQFRYPLILDEATLAYMFIAILRVVTVVTLPLPNKSS